ncbi:MAG: RNA methyltransferase [Oscillospiraceae bacterium]|nr:RNA methyltransferase [Oscillospiraceae bacterium]
METLSSRKNAYIRHVRALATDGAYRRDAGEYLCDGMKTLREALRFGAEIRSVLWKERPEAEDGLRCEAQYCAPAELFDYASPMKNSPGPLFCVSIPQKETQASLKRAIVLENVQDPGNVGTVVRTADALRIDAVILVGSCADLYHPKTVRATMGAIFRQRVLTMEREELFGFLKAQGLPLYAAALDEHAEDIRALDLRRAALAVGNEGRGLSRELLAGCEKTVIIPMNPESESLNAAVAASILMWEMMR